MIPLQTPGGPELLVIALIFLIFAAIVVGIGYLLRRIAQPTAKKQERVDELERRVEELEAKVRGGDYQ